MRIVQCIFACFNKGLFTDYISTYMIMIHIRKVETIKLFFRNFIYKVQKCSVSHTPIQTVCR